jgi:uncharacterized repeat protein (TIGR03803 family)
VQGCIFELSYDGSGWQQTVLHSFSGPDGSDPAGALLLDKAGNIYGTARGGSTGEGIAFELSPTGDGSWSEAVIYDFANSPDARDPESKLIFDAEGNLYGTTVQGGNYPNDGGGVYELSPGPKGWTETTLYTFPSSINGPDGDYPQGGLVMDKKGNLYGNTESGGEYGDGAVFELSPSGGGYAETIIHSFNGEDGIYPNAGLTMDADGNLYGTTSYGGGAGYSGTVFKLSKGADGTWSERNLLVMNGNDGATPLGPVVFDDKGNLYAAAEFGGPDNQGSVFMLTPTQSRAPWIETTLHRFDFVYPNGSDGFSPYAGVFYRAGRVFGTTSAGGVYDSGIVFEIVP